MEDKIEEKAGRAQFIKQFIDFKTAF